MPVTANRIPPPFSTACSACHPACRWSDRSSWGRAFRSFLKTVTGYCRLAACERPCPTAPQFFNRKDTLACIISSRSDIDDLVPTLTAYQIEWNKLHDLLQDLPESFDFRSSTTISIPYKLLADTMLYSIEDLTRLKLLWGDEFEAMIGR